MNKIIECMYGTVDIPKDYMGFANKLDAIGIKAYFVGGCVRDALLDLSYHDFDLFSLCNK